MRTSIPVTTLSRQGVAPAAGAAADTANGNFIGNNGKTWLEADNTDAAQHTVTIQPTRMVDGQLPAARTYTVAAGATMRIGPFPLGDYSGEVQVDADATTVTFAAYSL